MLCFFIRRQLLLYVRDDLPARCKTRVARHVHTCRRCRVELDRLQAFHVRLDRCEQAPPSDVLAHFAEDTMARVLQAGPGSPESAPPVERIFPRWIPGQRLVVAALLIILACCALVRQDWGGARALERSVVTPDGVIVSNAYLHGRAADVKVIQVDGSDMVIIWLKKTSPVTSVHARRG